MDLPKQLYTKMPATNLKNKFIQYNGELLSLFSLINDVLANGAKSTSASEDIVVFPLLVSAKNILEEILYVVAGGFGRLALRSIRTMYECVVAAYYINLHPELKGAFMKSGYPSWAKIFQNLPQQQISPETHLKLMQEVPKYAQGKMIGAQDLNWSGESIFNMAKEIGWEESIYAMCYDYSSAFIHPKMMFVTNQITASPENPSLLSLDVESQDNEGEMALWIAHLLMLYVIHLRLKYVPSDVSTKRLDQCKQDYVSIWRVALPTF